ncbi:MAG: MFS transporter [Candidatus Dormibacteraeota bacterium]|uniref:MFS transporter n=1 Tax=Candidatus Amunia macphersoniae TaxID=3127014 RepID=A0A934KLD9_9BACT|nr:MFS transporter [Candidatus Dormibacteraeota bacterium]
MSRAVWRQRDFSLLWGGQTVSEIGSQVTVLALPTLAIFSFHAGPAAIGLLVACERIPFPVLALPAGAIVDRVRKRPLMVTCSLARMAILAAIPALAGLDQLQLWHLFAAAVAMGVFTVFFDLAYLAYVPVLVRRDQLLEANSRLEVTWSAGALVGPGVGGVLVQAVGGARAVLVDAASFLLSAMSVLAIRHREPELATAHRHHLAREVGEGLRHVFGNPVLRAQLLCLTAAGVFAHAYEAPLFLFAYGRLHLSPGLLGAILAFGGLGSMLGSTVAGRVIARAGVGRTMALTDAVSIGLSGAIPLAVFVPAVALLFPLFLVIGAVSTAGNIAQMTLRQSLSPARLQGRMSAVFRSFFWGAWPLGNLLGGVLAASLGAVTTLWLTAALGVVASLSIVLTPLWRVREFPAPAVIAPGLPETRRL